MSEDRTTRENMLEVTTEEVLHGVILTPVVVKDGGELYLHGLISQTLTLETGGTAFVYGTVVGDVYNNGGMLYVKGMIVGKVERTAGITLLDTSAMIGTTRSP